MATRGTYTFNKQRGLQVNIYVHYDNYEEGAADYFRAMLQSINAARFSNRGAAEHFISTNKYAEITSSPEDHGDTEYHYVIDEQQLHNIKLTAYKIVRGKYDERVERCFFEGKLEEFCEKYPSVLPENLRGGV